MGKKRLQAGLRRGSFDASDDVANIGLVEIDDEQQRLCREELKATQTFEIVAGQLQGTQRLAFFECGLAALHQLAFFLELSRTAFLQIFLEALQTPFDDDEVRE